VLRLAQLELQALQDQEWQLAQARRALHLQELVSIQEQQELERVTLQVLEEESQQLLLLFSLLPP
jgi:hypothetical protein